MGGMYHVVCHECLFEEVYQSAERAMREQDAHEQEHDHRVSYLEISRPEPTTEA